MKKFCFASFLLFFTITGFSQKLIKLANAKENVGETVKICTRLFDVSYEENSKGSPTWLYTTANSTNAPLTFVIWGEKRKNFDYKPEKDLKGREVCITGKIELLKDKPILVIEKQSQIEIK